MVFQPVAELVTKACLASSACHTRHNTYFFGSAHALIIESNFARYIGVPISVAVDAYSGTILFEAHKRLTAGQTAAALEKIIQRFGPIRKVISDRGTEVG